MSEETAPLIAKPTQTIAPKATGGDNNKPCIKCGSYATSNACSCGRLCIACAATRGCYKFPYAVIMRRSAECKKCGAVIANFTHAPRTAADKLFTALNILFILLSIAAAVGVGAVPYKENMVGIVIGLLSAALIYGGIIIFILKVPMHPSIALLDIFLMCAISQFIGTMMLKSFSTNGWPNIITFLFGCLFISLIVIIIGVVWLCCCCCYRQR